MRAVDQAGSKIQCNASKGKRQFPVGAGEGGGGGLNASHPLDLPYFDLLVCIVSSSMLVGHLSCCKTGCSCSIGNVPRRLSADGDPPMPNFSGRKRWVLCDSSYNLNIFLLMLFSFVLRSRQITKRCTDGGV